jgi:hypothetical protein
LGVAALTLIGQAVHAAVVIPITPPPDAASATVFGINDSNIIGGAYRDADGIEHGFIGPLNGRYTVFDFGGTSTGTEPRSIANDGSMVGFATDPAFTTGEEFIRFANGTLQPILMNGSTLDGVAHGNFSARSVISVGDFQDPNFHFPGYIATNGTVQVTFNLQVPNIDIASTRPRAFNKDGTMAGFLEEFSGTRHGFILKGGTPELIDADDTGTTVIEGMNNREFMSGQVRDDAGNPHGFTYDNKTGRFHSIDLGDGSVFQQSWGVNSFRLITVSTSDGLSYVYCARQTSECPTGDGAYVVPDGREWQRDPQMVSVRKANAATVMRGEIQ